MTCYLYTACKFSLDVARMNMRLKADAFSLINVTQADVVTGKRVAFSRSISISSWYASRQQAWMCSRSGISKSSGAWPSTVSKSRQGLSFPTRREQCGEYNFQAGSSKAGVAAVVMAFIQVMSESRMTHAVKRGIHNMNCDLGFTIARLAKPHFHLV